MLSNHARVFSFQPVETIPHGHPVASRHKASGQLGSGDSHRGHRGQRPQREKYGIGVGVGIGIGIDGKHDSPCQVPAENVHFTNDRPPAGPPVGSWDREIATEDRGHRERNMGSGSVSGSESMANTIRHAKSQRKPSAIASPPKRSMAHTLTAKARATAPVTATPELRPLRPACPLSAGCPPIPPIGRCSS